MKTALAVEWLKLRRSLVVRVATLIACLGAPWLAIGLVALARSGLLAGPAREKFALALAGTVFEAHLVLATQVLSVVMLLGGGLVATWLYGREFAEGTFGALFALPVSRQQIALAKAVMAAGWSVSSAGLATLMTLLGSAIVSPATFDTVAFERGAVLFGSASVMGVLGLPFGCVAVATRGYLGAVAALLVATALSQTLASIGWGPGYHSWRPRCGRARAVRPRPPPSRRRTSRAP